MRSPTVRVPATILAAGLVASFALALPQATTAQIVDPDDVEPREREYSPYLGYTYPDRVFFGDTHVHSSY